MVTIQKDLCGKCGICLSGFKDYCLVDQGGYPEIDYSVCNQCQKCIAICPFQAFRMNGVSPVKIENIRKPEYGELISLLKFRRSTKKFLDRPVPEEVLDKITGSAAYAPNQNKNISLLVINDPEILSVIDKQALRFIGTIYSILFKNKIMRGFISLFSGEIPVIKKKMELDLIKRKHIVKENTQILILAVGNPKVPVTEASAHYLMGNMILTAEALDIGSTLMDSLKITFNGNRFVKKLLGIEKTDKILGVLALGYSGENRKNIPVGYEVSVFKNRMG